MKPSRLDQSGDGSGNSNSRGNNGTSGKISDSAVLTMFVSRWLLTIMIVMVVIMTAVVVVIMTAVMILVVILGVIGRTLQSLLNDIPRQVAIESGAKVFQNMKAFFGCLSQRLVIACVVDHAKEQVIFFTSGFRAGAIDVAAIVEQARVCVVPAVIGTVDSGAPIGTGNELADNAATRAMVKVVETKFDALSMVSKKI